MSLKARVEALLFLVDEPISALEIAQRVNADINDVREKLMQLLQEYEERETGLHINTEDGYIMQVQDQYEDMMNDVLPLEVKTGCLRTLSAIALKEPMFQADLVAMRGGGAYEHIKELIEIGLIVKRREGTKNVLRTTPKFTKFFKLNAGGIQLQDLLKDKSVKTVREAEHSIFDDQMNLNLDNEKTEEAEQISLTEENQTEESKTSIDIDPNEMNEIAQQVKEETEELEQEEVEAQTEESVEEETTTQEETTEEVNSHVAEEIDHTELIEAVEKLDTEAKEEETSQDSSNSFQAVLEEQLAESTENPAESDETEPEKEAEATI